MRSWRSSTPRSPAMPRCCSRPIWVAATTNTRGRRGRRTGRDPLGRRCPFDRLSPREPDLDRIRLPPDVRDEDERLRYGSHLLDLLWRPGQRQSRHRGDDQPGGRYLHCRPHQQRPFESDLPRRLPDCQSLPGCVRRRRTRRVHRAPRQRHRPPAHQPAGAGAGFTGRDPHVYPDADQQRHRSGAVRHAHRHAAGGRHLRHLRGQRRRHVRRHRQRADGDLCVDRRRRVGHGDDYRDRDRGHGVDDRQHGHADHGLLRSQPGQQHGDRDVAHARRQSERYRQRRVAERLGDALRPRSQQRRRRERRRRGSGRRRPHQLPGVQRGLAPARLRHHLPGGRRDRVVLRYPARDRQSDRHGGAGAHPVPARRCAGSAGLYAYCAAQPRHARRRHGDQPGERRRSRR